MENETLEQIEALEKYLSEHIEGASLDVHPYEVADLLMNVKKVDEQTYIDFLNKLPKDLLAEVIIELPRSEQEKIYERFGPKKLAKLTEELNTNDAADLIQHIEEIDEEKANAILSNLSEEDRDTIEELISFEENEAGAHMQVEIFEAHIDEKIGDSILRLKKMKKNNEIDNIHHVFVVSNGRTFVGMIPLEDLILHGPKELYKDVIDDEGKITVSVNPHDD
ncbi:MAG: magnesium transporter, partial [Sulfurovum sp.]|nr:magnesium transporter [Sulfurovum sp.]